MAATSMLRRPAPRQLGLEFQARTKCPPPPASVIYHNDTPSDVTAIPEYAPMGGVLIAYPGTVPPPKGHEQLPPASPRAFGIPNALIVLMQQNDSKDPVHIFVMCDDASTRPTIIQELQQTAKQLNTTFDADHLHLVPWDTDTYWTRDYGPWWIQNQKTGMYGIAKHIYTSLGGGSVGLVEGAEDVDPREGLGIFRPNDDAGAVKFSDYLNAPIRKWNKSKISPPIPVHNWYFTGLLDVGGNYMATGSGIIASSYLVATQNELPSESPEPCADVIPARMEYILEQLNRFMGINTYHVLTDPTGTYIGHIDCWGKFLEEDKVIIAQSQDPTTEAGLDLIAKSFTDEKFQVSRVMCQEIQVNTPSPTKTTAAYTNSLILNDRVYIPLAGSGYEDRDEAALRAYRDAMPDHQIVGIIGKPEFPWLGTDAMHCRTRGVPRDVVNNWLRSQQPPAVG